MFTSNINFKNFKIYNLNKYSKKILYDIKNNKWLDQFKIIETLKPNYKYSYNKKILKKYKTYKNFRIIGIGGSILGSEAIYQFLNFKIKKNFYFINNLQPLIKNKFKYSKVLNIIISKSGNTLETIANSNVIIKSSKNKNLFITEKKNSYLSILAKKLKAEVLEHRNYIGGRYSVLSEVGMLPAALMGLEEKKFKRLNNLVKNKNFLNSLIKSVFSTIYLINKKKYNSVILNYDENSENIFKWYQQLIAESLGKKSRGIFPIISSMPKDNHSLLQLYLDGPKNNFFTFYNVKEKYSQKLSNDLIVKNQNYLKNKNLIKILDSQREATMRVFAKKKLPFRCIELKNRSEESLGELFCFFILETILLGKALKVNPFDQPSVELIKTETKKILL